EKCVEAFNGQFAFALWDGNRRRLFLARDRMGTRPLFYAFHHGNFLFGSEIKALFEDPSLPREIDPFAIDQIFTFWFPTPPRTGFVGISELPPAHTLTLTENEMRISRYWSMEFPSWKESQSASPRPDRWYADRLMELLDDAVRIRLRADVPVGAYLSGGLDSSVIAALARRRCEGLKTFSIGFESEEFDETPFQSMAARSLRTDHQPFFCKTEEIGNAFPEAVWHIERPVVRAAPVPMMLLSRRVREVGIKVVLSGEGADEILAGYDIFKEAKVRRFWARVPRSTRRPLLLRRLYPYLNGMRGQAQGALSAFFGQGLTETDDPFYSHRPRWRSTASIKGLYSEETRRRLKGYDPIDELRAALPEAFGGWHVLSQAQYLETAYLLPGYILSSQGDRTAMANSVEQRFPFLDHRVVEFAAQIPPSLKMRRLQEKHILRQGSRGLIPQAILDREKRPFRAPDRAAVLPDGKGRPYVEEVFSRPALEETGIFAPPAVQTLLNKIRRGGAATLKDEMALIGSLSTQLLSLRFVSRQAEAKG
ncbi:MAG TPA: asparagine synthase (glutamine-hydrolyzing), partial [Candidatus Manganitrophaceae bacterium]